MRKPHSCANCTPIRCRLLDAARAEMALQPDMFTLMERMNQQPTGSSESATSDRSKEAK